jgi:hypothetical protein
LDAAADDAVKAAGLRTRIRELEMHSRRTGLREIALGLRLVYHFSINGEATVQEGKGNLAKQLCVNSAIGWPIEFWLGAYDADALAGFVEGSLRIPYRSAP